MFETVVYLKGCIANTVGYLSGGINAPPSSQDGNVIGVEEWRVLKELPSKWGSEEVKWTCLHLGRRRRHSSWNKCVMALQRRTEGTSILTSAIWLIFRIPCCLSKHWTLSPQTLSFETDWFHEWDTLLSKWYDVGVARWVFRIPKGTRYQGSFEYDWYYQINSFGVSPSIFWITGRSPRSSSFRSNAYRQRRSRTWTRQPNCQDAQSAPWKPWPSSVWVVSLLV